MALLLSGKFYLILSIFRNFVLRARIVLTEFYTRLQQQFFDKLSKIQVIQVFIGSEDFQLKIRVSKKICIAIEMPIKVEQLKCFDSLNAFVLLLSTNYIFMLDQLIILLNSMQNFTYFLTSIVDRSIDKHFYQIKKNYLIG